MFLAEPDRDRLLLLRVERVRHELEALLHILGVAVGELGEIPFPVLGTSQRRRESEEGEGEKAAVVHGFRYLPMNSKMRFFASFDSSVSPSVKMWPPAAFS